MNKRQEIIQLRVLCPSVILFFLFFALSGCSDNNESELSEEQKNLIQQSVVPTDSLSFHVSGLAAGMIISEDGNLYNSSAEVLQQGFSLDELLEAEKGNVSAVKRAEPLFPVIYALIPSGTETPSALTVTIEIQTEGGEVYSQYPSSKFTLEKSDDEDLHFSLLPSFNSFTLPALTRRASVSEKTYKVVAAIKYIPLDLSFKLERNIKVSKKQEGI